MAGPSVATMRYDAEARHAALDERVTNLGNRFSGLESTVARNFQQIDAAMAASAAETRTSLNAIQNEIRGNSKTPWGTIGTFIGVSAAIIAMIGGLALNSVNEAISRLEGSQIDIAQALDGLPTQFITRSEVEVTRQRNAEERELTRQALTALNADKLNHSEWKVRNDLVNAEIAGLSMRLNRIEELFIRSPSTMN